MRDAELSHAERPPFPPDLMAAIERANALISQHPPESSEAERGLEQLRILATGPAGPAAQWLLGTYYLPKLWLRGGHAAAVHWLERAAESGVPPAIDRLANTCLRGIGIERDAPRAFGLFQRLADAGFQGAAWDLAYLVDRNEFADPPVTAATAFARAAALAFPPAYYSLGLRFALGEGVAADAAFARALLRRAEDAGYPDAAAAADDLALPPLGNPAVRDWYETLKRNVDGARPHLNRLAQAGMTIPPGLNPAIPALETEFARIAHPTIVTGADGRLLVKRGGDAEAWQPPHEWRWLSTDPRVAEMEDFASREECAHLCYVSGPSLKKPREYTGDTVNGAFETLHFKGRAHSMGAMLSDTVVRLLEQRMAASLDWPLAAIEPCSVIAYQPGQDYDWHADFFSHEQIAHNREQSHDLGDQRVITFLLCLHAPESGGGTVYRHNGLEVRHRRGKAAIHYNVTAAGEPDPHSLHRGLPVLGGEKWLLRTTLREHSRYASGSE